MATPLIRSFRLAAGSGVILVALIGLVLTARPLTKQVPVTAVQHQTISFTNPSHLAFDVSSVGIGEQTGATLTNRNSTSDIVLLDPLHIPSGSALVSFDQQAAILNDTAINYQLTTDGRAWVYFDGSDWVPARDCSTCVNGADVVNAHISNLPLSSNELQVRAFLTAGTQNVPILNSVDIGTSGGDGVVEVPQVPSNITQALAHDKVKICHKTSSESNPYVFLEVDPDAVDGDGNNDHSHHDGDIIPITDRNGDGITNDDDCTAPIPHATISATKIVCDAESQLPNWGGGGADITSSTATSFVSSHSSHCHLEPNWKFQWAPADAADPGDNLGEVGNPWTTFGPTNASGVATTSVDLTDVGDRIWMREQLKTGYLGFGYSNGNNPNSAELYCNADVLNYDNYDFILNPQANHTYYCVAFNVSTTTSNWDHSEIAVTGTCTVPSAVFTITNSGSSMSGTSQYRVYRNNVLENTQTFQLTAGQSTTVTVAGNGDSIRVEADQRPDHPGDSHPQATVASCGTPPPTATIVATKIVCDAETDLPNWGSGGPDVTSTTATAYVSTHPHCHLQSGWKFQWAPSTAADPGDNLGEVTSPWTSFGPTNASGVTTTTVGLTGAGDRIWMREALQTGYLGFGYSNGNNPNSAELYCHTDVLNYDNYDFILNPQASHTYYCVALNVQTPDTSDHSNVAVAGVCQAPYAVFTLTNTGTGPMTSPSQYRIYRNNVLTSTQTFQLTAGQSQVVSVAATGDSIRVEADQLPGHTGAPQATIEHCGTPNQPPVANDDSAATTMNTPVVVNVLANDSDPDGTLVPGTVTVTHAPLHGVVSAINGLTGATTYAPNAGFFGTDTYTYQACDNDGLCDTAVVTVTIKAPPLAVDDTVTTPFQTPVTVPVLTNDSDPDGSLVPSTVTVTSAPTHGAITNVNHSTGEVTYTPNIGFTGTDFFTYQVCDNDGLCDTATVAVSVATRVLHPPVAVDDSTTTPRDTSTVVDVLANDSDSDGTLVPSTVLVTLPPVHGTISFVNPTTGEVTYAPTAGFSGTDQFTYQVCDDDGLCDTAIVVIHVVAPPPVPPVANDDSASTTENAPVSIDLLANDSDSDGVVVPATVTVVSGPLNGTVTINHTDGSATYTPTHGFSGVDTFTYQVCDNDSLCDTATVTIAVSALLPPVANDDSAVTAPSTPVTIDLLANDTDADGTLVPASTTVALLPTHGSVSINPLSGQATYTPDNGFFGSDTFSYIVCDNDGLCDTATVFVTVTEPEPVPPVANDDAAVTDQDTSVVIPVLTNDSDSDGVLVPGTVTVTVPPANGTIDSINPLTGAITYTPDTGYSGLDTFTYQVCDDDGLCDTATVTIGINEAHVPPVANDDSAATTTNTPVVVPLLGNDFDIDGTIVIGTTTVVSNPTHGTVTINGTTGNATYTPATGFTGTDQFTYQVCDNDGLCDTAVVTVRVTALGEPPVPPTTPTPPPLLVPAAVPLAVTPVTPPAPAAGALMFGANQFVLAAQSQPLSTHGVLQITTNQPQTFYLEARNATAANLINLDTKTVFPLTFDQNLKLWTGTFSFPTAGTFHLQGQILNGTQSYTRAINQIVVSDPSTVSGNGQSVDATVTVYERDVATGAFHQWNGSTYAHANPFPVDGSFSLVLPSGQFYLRVQAPGFRTVTSRIVSLAQQSLVSAHVELQSSGIGIAQFLSQFAPSARSNNFEVAVTQLPQPQQLPLDTPVPGIAAHDQDGTTTDIVAAQQRPTVIMVYGNWNTLSQQQLDVFSSVAQSLASTATFIPLSTMDPDRDDLSYLQRGEYNLPFYKPTDAFFDQYFIGSLPEFLILDANHRLLNSTVGPQSVGSLTALVSGTLGAQ